MWEPSDDRTPQSFKDKMLKHKSVIFLAVSEIIFIIFFGAFLEYGESAKPAEKQKGYFVTLNLVNKTVVSKPHGHDQSLAISKTHGIANHQVDTFNVTAGHRTHTIDVTYSNIATFDLFVPETSAHEVNKDYALFQDCHVMIIVGFGFLMTFLKRYAYSAVSINLLLAAYIVQWHTIFLGFFELDANNKFHVGLNELFLGEFCAGAVLISMGVMLGKLSPIQYLILAFLETIFYTINEFLVFEVFYANDVGGSMNLHTFGAYFGLTVALILYNPNEIENKNEKTVYYSNLFSIIGCLFLWIYWPSFNGALATPDDARMRAVINTYFSLAACTISTFAFSAMCHRRTQFDMDLIQNATLAGGVAIGSAANLFVTPLGAIVVGSISGILSVVGFEYIQPFLERKIHLHDTCGVHNLHGLPGILGGIISIIMAALATEGKYGHTVTDVFAARGAKGDHHHMVMPNRSAGQQAGFQALALFISLLFAIVGGIITGFFLKLKIFDNIDEVDHFFNDDVFFETTEDFAGLGEMIQEAKVEMRRRSTQAAIETGRAGLPGVPSNEALRFQQKLSKLSDTTESDHPESDAEEAANNHNAVNGETRAS